MARKKKLKFIGLTGLAGYGKTEVSKILQDKTGFEVVAISDRIKATASAIYNIDISAFYKGFNAVENFSRETTIIEPYGLTIRQMMQLVGDTMKDQHGGDFWIELLKVQMDMAVINDPDIKGFIIEDVRFDNSSKWGMRGSEYHTIKSWGGSIIHIDASERVGELEVHKSHVSENGVIVLEDDFVLDNNGDVQSLDQQITKLVKRKRWNQ